MFEELGRILGDTGFPMTHEDLLDVLWLAARIPSGPAAPLAGQARGTEDRQPPDTDSTPSDLHAKPGPHTLPDPGAEPSADPTRQHPSHLAMISGPFSAGASAAALWTPGVRSLGPALQLGRALRPLKRRVPSRWRSELDEVASAELQAEARTVRQASRAQPERWLPLVLRAQPERWLRLVLIVDGGVSMLLWERQCAELRELFERSGAFRHVETYQIRYNTGEADIRLGRPWSTSAATRPADAVADGSGRTMVLVVTDGAAVAWRDGRLRPALEGWARSGPTAVIHTLPRRLWAGSGVRADTWQVTSPRPGAPNCAWTVTDQVLPPSVAPPPPVPLPVLDLTPDGFATWAAVNTTVGRPTPVRLWTPHRAQEPAAESVPVSVRDFGRAASPEALRLAAHLAAMAPVTVPVMRLVHSCLDQRQGAVPLAEVLLGGLVQPLPASGDAQYTGRHRLFDFTAEAKDLLLDAVPTAELLECSRRVGERIESLVGHSSDFPAWPQRRNEAADAAPFAYVGPALQARLGLSGGLPDDVTPDVVVLSPSAAAASEEEVPEDATAEWVSGDGLAGSLRLLLEMLDGHVTLVPELRARYLDATEIPTWGLVMSFVDLTAEMGSEPPAEVRTRLRAQFVDAMLPRCPTEVQTVFARLRDTAREMGLLLLHLLLYVYTKPAGARLEEEEIAEDLRLFLDERGLHLDRESRIGPGYARRYDLLWRDDDRYCSVEIKRSGSPFDWAAFGQTAESRERAGDFSPISFLVAVDDDEKPDGPVPLEDCVWRKDDADGVVIGLRLQTGTLPAPPPQMGTQATQRVCIVVDTVGFGAMDDADQRASRSVLWAALDQAMREAGVSRDECLLQNHGDGAVVVLPSGVDVARAVPGFIDGLAVALWAAHEQGDGTRVRVAMDLGGVVTSETHALSGHGVVRAAGLAHATVLRKPRFAYAVLLSQSLFEKVPAFHGHLQRVEVRENNFQGPAWLKEPEPSRGERPRPAGLPDLERSDAALIGVGSYAELPDLPQVSAGLDELARLLTDPVNGGFAPGRSTVMSDPVDRTEVMDVVHRAAQSAEDTLLVYFAGHGLYDSVSGELSLAIRPTRPGFLHTALLFDDIRMAVTASAARRKVIILDCCYSGAAVGAGLPGVLNLEPYRDGITLLAASATFAAAPQGAVHMAFTGEIIRVLKNGLEGGSEVISLDALYQEVHRRCTEENLPRPAMARQAGTGVVALARNPVR